MIDPILYWNGVTLEVHRRDFSGDRVLPEVQGPTATSRAFAMIHLAMRDAWIGSVSPQGQPYLTPARVPDGSPFPNAPAANTSREAAVAGAAVRVLKELFPRPSAYIDERRMFFEECLLGSQTQANIDAGKVFGETIGQRMVDARSNDGSLCGGGYRPTGNPYWEHRPDPYNPDQGFLGAHWGGVTLFYMQPGDVVTDPHPLPNTVPYKKAFNDVRRKGALAGHTREIEETAAGIFWAYDGARGLGTPPRLYNQCIRTVVLDPRVSFSMEEKARLFALVNMGMAEAGIFAWREKYLYKLWRPVIGIREATDDYGLPVLRPSNVEADPFWRPLGSPRSNQVGAGAFTPNFPAYPSGHATFGTAAFQILKDMLPSAVKNAKFTFVSDELDGRTLDSDGSQRTLNRRELTLSKAIKENIRSRVYLGVHWQFDGDYGEDIGKTIADKLKSALPV